MSLLEIHPHRKTRVFQILQVWMSFLTIRGEHVMEANEMEPGPRDERRQALEEFQRSPDEMSGAMWFFMLPSLPNAC